MSSMTDMIPWLKKKPKKDESHRMQVFLDIDKDLFTGDIVQKLYITKSIHKEQVRSMLVLALKQLDQSTPDGYLDIPFEVVPSAGAEMFQPTKG